MKQFWEDRYKQNDFAYGEDPNSYFKNKITHLKPGKILFAAEGEGRNAVYAATLGWDVYAFDISTEGRKKALQLAEKNNTEITYHIGELPALNFKEEQFDAIVLIYAHFPPSIKSRYYTLLSKMLKKGGTLIFEGFSKNHIAYRERNPNVGGPANIDALFSVEELKSYFQNFEFSELTEKEIELNEGLYHKGKASVIRCFGRKK